MKKETSKLFNFIRNYKILFLNLPLIMRILSTMCFSNIITLIKNLHLDVLSQQTVELNEHFFVPHFENNTLILSHVFILEQFHAFVK